MALRNNVYDLKLELWPLLKPLEYFLVDLIIDKTIKWRQKEAKINMEDLEEKTKERRDYIYIALKSLEDKKVIIRRKVKHDSFVALNEDYFGELLIKKHADAWSARRNRIKIVVNNKTEIQSKEDLNPVLSGLESSLVKTEIQSEIDTQQFEIIKENVSLNTLLKNIPLNTSLKDSKTGEGSGESYALTGGSGTKSGPWEKTEMTDNDVAKRKAFLREQQKLLGFA